MRRPRAVVAAPRAFLFAAQEDFGIAPVEAQAAGTPVIAYGRGGVRESIRGLDDRVPTGVFFDAQTPQAVADAVREFETATARISAAACRENALRFSRRRASATRSPAPWTKPAPRAPAPSLPPPRSPRMRRNLLKEHSSRLEWALQFADPLFVVAVGVIAYRSKFDSWDLEARYVTALLGVALIAFAVFSTLRFTSRSAGVSFAEELRSLFIAWLVIGG